MINIKQHRNGDVQLTMSPEELRCIIDAVFSDALNIGVWLKEYSSLSSQSQRDLVTQAEDMMKEHKELMAIYNDLMTGLAINHIDVGRKGGTGHGRV